ncbi:MAG: AraC family transcriptional regulator, partial [Spirochaetales bacterium]|nr:AraC family transcriptional regulator [Spirochaetales bacterium]
ETLQNGLIEEFKNRHQDYRSTIVAQVQRYVDENLDKKLLLSEVASIHGLSQSYLSTLLSRYGGCSFVEYTSKAKVAAAKRMMCDEKLLIQDIAERLGYENAFYFSKVFKKYEGVSPRDYIQQMVIR